MLADAPGEGRTARGERGQGGRRLEVVAERLLHHQSRPPVRLLVQPMGGQAVDRRPHAIQLAVEGRSQICRVLQAVFKGRDLVVEPVDSVEVGDGDAGDRLR